MSDDRKYIFVREDDGQPIEVDWQTMMTQSGGYITLPDGVCARRSIQEEVRRYGDPLAKKPRRNAFAPTQEYVSDTMGFGQFQLAEMQYDLEQSGIKGVEFRPDPDVPEFYRVHSSSLKARDRYMQHREFVNKTSFGIDIMGQEEFDKAVRLVKDRYGGAENTEKP